LHFAAHRHIIGTNGGAGRREKEKLIRRLKERPKDFTFEEAETLLGYFAYRPSQKGKTSGSRVMFVSPEHAPILLHKPHPRKELLDYQVRQLLEALKQEGLV
jgi:hypothetical protein